MLSIDEINDLEKMYPTAIKQYNSLLKKYNEVLKIAKENTDANEYCLQSLECKIESLSRENDKLKEEVLNLRGQNIQYELVLRDIKNTAKNNIKLGCVISGGWLEQKIDEVLKDD
ncbi:hypothetical protein [Faecalibacillus faecis]|uniref:hypothetical protein n=1 Tax=Faecalibacillus faecis TaxID=1982628 RepID=UPI003868E2E5